MTAGTYRALDDMMRLMYRQVNYEIDGKLKIPAVIDEILEKCPRRLRLHRGLAESRESPLERWLNDNVRRELGCD